MSAIPTSTEALRVPGEGCLGSCGDGATKAWEKCSSWSRSWKSAPAAFEALSVVLIPPPGCEALPAVLNSRWALERCPQF